MHERFHEDQICQGTRRHKRPLVDTPRVVRDPWCPGNIVRLLMLCLCCVSNFHGEEAQAQQRTQQEDGTSEHSEQEQLPPSPFTEPQKRSKRIRYNSGT